MSDETKLHVSVLLTPEQVAEAWWNMATDEQIQFYAHLRRIAGHNLCMQAQSIINTIAETDNHDAREGFCTMHDYAAGYVENAADWRAFNAQSDIRRMTKHALESYA